MYRQYLFSGQRDSREAPLPDRRRKALKLTGGREEINFSMANLPWHYGRYPCHYNLIYVAKGKVRATSPPSTPVASQTARDALATGRVQVVAIVTHWAAIIACVDCEGWQGFVDSGTDYN